MALVALLSNPNSTGNRALLPRIRSFCAQHPEVFHYEVEDAGQIGDALASIARVSPKVLILNGGMARFRRRSPNYIMGAISRGACRLWRCCPMARQI